MDLRRSLSRFSKGGSILYATIESIENGLATVLLPGGKQRITNLPIVDVQINVGDTVLVDYSSGTPPLVKRITKEQPISDDFELAEASEKDNEDYLGSIGFAYTSTSDITVTSNSWTKIVLTSEIWDDANFLSGNQYIIPQNGMYFVTANLAFHGLNVSGWEFTNTYIDFRALVSDNDTEYLLAKLSGTVYGTIAIKEEYGFDANANTICTVSLSGLILGTEGEEIQLHVKPVSTNSTIVLDAYNSILPKIACQRIDINSGETAVIQGFMS